MSGPFIPGTSELIAAIVERVTSGASMDNPKLTQLADAAFQGTRPASCAEPGSNRPPVGDSHLWSPQTAVVVPPADCLPPGFAPPACASLSSPGAVIRAPKDFVRKLFL